MSKAMARIIARCIHRGTKTIEEAEPEYIQSEAMPYQHNPDLTNIPHSFRSVKIIEKYIYLTEEEEYAILYHDGLYERTTGGFSVIPTAAVAKGDAWTIGTNVTAANVGSEINALVSKTDNMKASFQAGVDGIYNAITAQGTTPASKSQSDVQAAIPTLANNSYNKGYANGRNDSPIHVQYIRSWAAGASAGEINIRIIVTKNGRQVYDTGNFRPYNTDSKEFDC